MKQIQFNQEVEAEQLRILRRWLRLHSMAVKFLILAAALVEALMCAVAVNSASFQANSAVGYLYKYLLVPTGLNLLVMGGMELLLAWDRPTLAVKRYVVSLTMLSVTVVLYTIHSVLTATVPLFLVTVLLTGHLRGLPSDQRDSRAGGCVYGDGRSVLRLGPLQDPHPEQRDIDGEFPAGSGEAGGGIRPVPDHHPL